MEQLLPPRVRAALGDTVATARALVAESDKLPLLLFDISLAPQLCNPYYQEWAQTPDQKAWAAALAGQDGLAVGLHPLKWFADKIPAARAPLLSRDLKVIGTYLRQLVNRTATVTGAPLVRFSLKDLPSFEKFAPETNTIVGYQFDADMDFPKLLGTTRSLFGYNRDVQLEPVWESFAHELAPHLQDNVPEARAYIEAVRVARGFNLDVESDGLARRIAQAVDVQENLRFEPPPVTSDFGDTLGRLASNAFTALPGADTVSSLATHILTTTYVGLGGTAAFLGLDPPLVAAAAAAPVLGTPVVATAVTLMAMVAGGVAVGALDDPRPLYRSLAVKWAQLRQGAVLASSQTPRRVEEGPRPATPPPPVKAPKEEEEEPLEEVKIEQQPQQSPVVDIWSLARERVDTDSSSAEEASEEEEEEEESPLSPELTAPPSVRVFTSPSWTVSDEQVRALAQYTGPVPRAEAHPNAFDMVFHSDLPQPMSVLRRAAAHVLYNLQQQTTLSDSQQDLVRLLS